MMICSVEGCNRKAAANGKCKAIHGGRNYCKEDGCTRLAKVGGLCFRHFDERVPVNNNAEQEQNDDRMPVVSAASTEQISRAAAVVSPTVKSDWIEQARAKVSIIESAEEHYLSLKEERSVYEMGKDLQHVCDMRIDAYKNPHYTRELKKRFALNELPNPTDEELEDAAAVLAEAKGLDSNKE